MAENVDGFEQRVFAAADKLRAEGKKTTVRAVEFELGGGNRNKITDAMKKWREINGDARRQYTDQQQLPQDLVRALGSFARQCGDDAAKILADQTKTLEEDVADANSEVERARNALDEARAEIDNLRSVLTHTEAELSALRATHTDLQQEYSTYRNAQQDAAAQLAEARALERIARQTMQDITRIIADALRGGRSEQQEEQQQDKRRRARKQPDADAPQGAANADPPSRRLPGLEEE